MKVKENWKSGLKANIQKTKIMASGSITSWQIEGKKVETVTDFIFLGSKITVDNDFSHEIKRPLVGFPGGSEVKASAWNAGDLGREDPLEKDMATHSSTLAWRIPWREEPGRLQSMGSQRVGHDWVTSLSFFLSFCPLEESYDWLSILKSKDITLPKKFYSVKATVFSVVMYGCELWTIKKAEFWRIDAFKLWC